MRSSRTIRILVTKIIIKNKKNKNINEKLILIYLKYIIPCGVMAERLLQSTVNTFFRGSTPLGAYKLNYYNSF